MKKTEQMTCSSFFNETVNATANELIQILGEPEYGREDAGEKAQFDWEMETDDGDFFTIYDWKEYRNFSEDENINWHIGGVTASGSKKGKRELINALNK